MLRMSSRDEDILDFDFFDEEDAPAWEEPEGVEPLPPARPWPARRRLAVRTAAQPHAAPAPDRAHRARDPRRRPARRLDRGLHGRREARSQQHVPRRDRRDRQCVCATRPAAEHAAHDAGAEPGGSRREARRLRPDRRHPGAARGGSEPARRDGRPEHGGGRVAPLPGQRPARAPERVPGDRGRDGREHRGRAAPRADAAAACERHHLDGLVPGARRGRAAGGADRGSRRPVVGVRHGGGLRQPGPIWPRSGSGSRVRRRAGRRPASTATRSPRSRRCRAGSCSRRRPRRRSR